MSAPARPDLAAALGALINEAKDRAPEDAAAFLNAPEAHADFWPLLSALSQTFAALKATPERSRQLSELAPSQDEDLKILWLQFEAPQKKRTRAQAKKSSKVQPPMTGDDKIKHFVDALNASRPVDEDRQRILSELSSKTWAVSKDEMIAIAYGVLRSRHRTKKDALKALESWFWHRVRGRTSADQMTRAGAR